MTQALSEQVYPWNGGEGEGVWPPRSALSGSTSYEVEGTVLKHYALNVRKAKEQQGFLKQAVSGDVNYKHRALEVKIASIKDLKTNTSISTNDSQKIFGDFIQLASGSANTPAPHLLPGAAGVAVFWADATLTLGATLCARTVEIVHQPEQNKLKPKLDDQPNLFAGAKSNFNPAAAAAISKPKAAAKDEDEWDD